MPNMLDCVFHRRTSSVQEINRRKSNFFSQAPEPIRLDVKSVLDPHPAASPAGTLSAVPISLGNVMMLSTP